MIRPAVASDAAVIGQLLAQLGYPASVADIPGRLEALANQPGAAAFVATNPHGELVGLITVHIIPSIHDDDPVAWLTTLVVLDDARGDGIGSALVRHVEEWAAQRGAKRLSVTSGMQRQAAHKFYDNRGYERTGLRFTKRLDH